MRRAHPSLAELSAAWAERRALCGFGGARGGRVGTVAPCVASALGPPPTGPQLGPVTVMRGRGEDVPSLAPAPARPRVAVGTVLQGRTSTPQKPVPQHSPLQYLNL